MELPVFAIKNKFLRVNLSFHSFIEMFSKSFLFKHFNLYIRINGMFLSINLYLIVLICTTAQEESKTLSSFFTNKNRLFKDFDCFDSFRVL